MTCARARLVAPPPILVPRVNASLPPVAQGDLAPRPRALFFHGAGAWGGQWAIWRRIFEAEGWQVETPDFQSVAGGLAATQLDDYLAQAAAMIEASSLAALVGASLGGLLAVAAGPRIAPLAGPDRLVLVNPLPPAPWAADLPAFDAMGDVVPWHSAGRFPSTRRALPDAGFSDQQFAFRHWRDESAAVLRRAYAGMSLPRPVVPTLIITSERDETIPPRVSAAYAEGIGASLCPVTGGHLAPVMGPSAVAAARAALAWLSRS